MLDNRIIFTNLPPGVQTCINTHLLGLILAFHRRQERSVDRAMHLVAQLQEAIALQYSKEALGSNSL